VEFASVAGVGEGVAAARSNCYLSR